MTDLLPITLEDQIAELQREVILRHRVYPRWVADGKLKRDKADRQIAVMEAAVETLQKLAVSTGAA